MSTLATTDPPGVMATKSLGLSGKNTGRGLDSIAAIIILFDAETRHPVAIMDGSWITAKLPPQSVPLPQGLWPGKI